MKTFLKTMMTIALFSFLLNSCEEDDGITNVILNELPPPTNVNATIDILEGNRRAITVTPSGDNVTSFNVFFGETAGEVPVAIGINSTTSYIYQGEGTFIVEVQGVSPSNVTASIFFSVDIEL